MILCIELLITHCNNNSNVTLSKKSETHYRLNNEKKKNQSQNTTKNIANSHEVLT